MSDPIRPARVVLRVSDVDQSLAFYRDVVGLTPDGATLRAPGGEVLVDLRQAQRAGQVTEQATGLFHTAFLHPTRAALGATLRRVARAGVQLTGASHHLVSEALYCRDPDGHGIELYRDLPREEWPAPDPGERVKMDSIPLDVASLLDEDEITSGADGVVIGHVHLKVADVEQAIGFWTGTIGMDLTTRFGDQAAFLASGDYHHHIGANTWQSRGGRPQAADGPGLDAVVLHGPTAAEHITPDGIAVHVEA